MDAADAAILAQMFREAYSPDALDTGVTEPTVQEFENGSRSITLPREQMWEPYRSLHLIDAVAMGSVLVITFAWHDGEDDDTIYLMPLDVRDLQLEISDTIAVKTFLSHHLEFTLGGPRSTWEAARTTPLSPRFAVVRPWTSAG